MDNIDLICMENLENNNSKQVYLKASEILLKLLKNILDNPTKESFKSIRVSNPNIASKLLNAIGAKQCLIKIGFVEENDRLTLPSNVEVKIIYQYYEYLLIRRTMILSQNECNGPSTSKTVNEQETTNYTQNASKANEGDYKNVSSNNQGNNCTSEQKKSNNKKVKTDSFLSEASTSSQGRIGISEKDTLRVLNTSNTFLQSMETNSLSVLAYEDPILQKRALLHIPVVSLQIRAIEKMRQIQKSVKTGECSTQEPLLNDLILLELLNWFKNDFFTWVDKAPCDKCGNKKTISAGTKICAGERVEIYYCNLCELKTSFTRHCNPGVLLKTRRGRCGEWANCFTLLCRAMGWPSRYVVDDSDHVWTEVYSESEGRWLHCDPCENVCDTPLMYEQGWGKHPRYIIAYSCDDIQDVTWRYTTDHKGTLQRRTACSEKELLNAIEKLRNQRQKNLTETRKKYLSKRTLKELVELMTPRNPKESEKQSRTSGSLSWRLARGETQNKVLNYVWLIDDLSDSFEDDKKRFKLQYTTSRDIYECYDNKGNILKSVVGWSNGLYYFQDVFRKEEKDWKMVYLARNEKASAGKLVYRFAINQEKFVIDEILTKIETDAFENGNVSCTICSGDLCMKTKQDKTLQTFKEFKGQKYIEVSINLSGGKGSVAWQHAQLFRQSVASITSPFHIEIILKKI